MCLGWCLVFRGHSRSIGFGQDFDVVVCGCDFALSFTLLGVWFGRNRMCTSSVFTTQYATPAATPTVDNNDPYNNATVDDVEAPLGSVSSGFGIALFGAGAALSAANCTFAINASSNDVTSSVASVGFVDGARGDFEGCTWSRDAAAVPVTSGTSMPHPRGR